MNASLGELQSQVRELKEMVLQLQQQTTASRAEISHLRQELEAQRGANSTQPSSAESTLDEPSPAVSSSSYRPIGASRRPACRRSAIALRQDRRAISDEAGERLEISGALFRASCCSTCSAIAAIPTIRTFPRGCSGLIPWTRQARWAARCGNRFWASRSLGRSVFGAHSSGNVNFDFGGGFPATYNGVNSGLARLRTATVRLDWKDTSVIVGQDGLFLSPQAPTSFASLIVPALTYSGNLWSWTPQLRVEHRFEFSNHSNVSLQGGVLDPLTGRNAQRFQLRLVPGSRCR